MRKIHVIMPLVTLVLFMVGCINTTKDSEVSRPTVNIVPNDTIQSPLTVHINSEGSWVAFEGELGTVTLLDNQGNEISTAIMKSEDGKWMTSQPAPFIANLKFSILKDQTGSLVFKSNFVSEEGGDEPKEFSIPVMISSANTGISVGEVVTTWCFAEKSETMNSPEGTNYNYQFISASVDADNNVSGWIVSAPYGMDGMKGHLSGKYDQDSKMLILNQTAMGEGQIYEQQRNFKIVENALQLDYGNPDNTPAQLKQYECNDFDALFKEFQNGIISNQVNTTDRSRLMKIHSLKEIGYTEEQLKGLRFMELETDLNNDFSSREFLVYVMDPMLCGTGGCSLYIVDDKGNTLSYITVTKLPIYTRMPSIEAQQKEKGRWNDLFVWSNGAFRQLKHDGTAYPTNPSTEPEISETELTSHPEKYRMLLNLLD